MSYYVVDRIERQVAIVVSDDGRRFEVTRRQLPKGSREGTVLRVDAGGETIDWSQAEIDEAEQARRLEQARDTLRRLGDTDQGGDVKL